MEEILRKLQKDASGHKHKGIRDACVYACGECTSNPLGPWLQGVGVVVGGKASIFTC